MDIIAEHVNRNGIRWAGLGDQGISVHYSVVARDLFLHGESKPGMGSARTLDTRAFPSDKQMGPEADHLPPSSTQVNACYVQHCVFLAHIGTSCTF
jgi:hypothetical protein